MARALCVVATLLPFCSAEFSNLTKAAENQSHILARESISPARRKELAAKLRKITGWSDLEFDRSGGLRVGDSGVNGGSKTAREFLSAVIRGPAIVVLEDVSKNPDVAFCRVNPARWAKDPAGKPAAYVVQIDFADFEQVTGDERALEAFDVGWGLLHELDHVVNDSHDPSSLDEAGPCEAHINQMRRESNLPERANYYFTPLPLTADPVFITRLVRLGFDEPATSKKKRRYWLVWDANVVGGLDVQKQVASLR